MTNQSNGLGEPRNARGKMIQNNDKNDNRMFNKSKT